MKLQIHELGKEFRSLALFTGQGQDEVPLTLGKGRDLNPIRQSRLDAVFEEIEFWVADRAELLEECSRFDKRLFLVCRKRVVSSSYWNLAVVFVTQTNRLRLCQKSVRWHAYFLLTFSTA